MISARSITGAGVAATDAAAAEGVACTDATVVDDSDEVALGDGRAVPVWPVAGAGIASHSPRLKIQAAARSRLTVQVITIATISVRGVWELHDSSGELSRDRATPAEPTPERLRSETTRLMYEREF